MYPKYAENGPVAEILGVGIVARVNEVHGRLLAIAEAGGPKNMWQIENF